MDIELVTSIAREICQSKSWGEPFFIDAGASAAVFKVDHPELHHVALKVYDPAFFEGANALIEEKRLELQVSLTALSHPNLIRTLAAERFDSRGTWFLLMEYCAWPSLQKALAKVPDGCVGAIITQLADAVAFLSRNDIVHRDIKPANIVISPSFDRIILLDLGVLRSISFAEGNGTDTGEKRRFVATAQYSPPEYISRNELPGKDGFNALNVYQIGAVLHDLIMKRPIFNEESETLNRFILYSAIVQKVPTIFNSQVAPRLISLCRASLLKDAAKRIAAVSVEDFLQDADTIDDIRKRLAPQRKPRSVVKRLSALPWVSRIRAWIAEAAIAEKSVLGPYTLHKASVDGVHGWDLNLDDHGVVLRFILRYGEDGTVMELCLDSQDRNSLTPILNIGESGVDIPTEQIVPQIREQLLYTLDSLPTRNEGTAAE